VQYFTEFIAHYDNLANMRNQCNTRICTNN